VKLSSLILPNRFGATQLRVVNYRMFITYRALLSWGPQEINKQKSLNSFGDFYEAKENFLDASSELKDRKS